MTGVIFARIYNECLIRTTLKFLYVKFIGDRLSLATFSIVLQTCQVLMEYDSFSPFHWITYIETREIVKTFDLIISFFFLMNGLSEIYKSRFRHIKINCYTLRSLKKPCESYHEWVDILHYFYIKAGFHIGTRPLYVLIIRNGFKAKKINLTFISNSRFLRLFEVIYVLSYTWQQSLIWPRYIHICIILHIWLKIRVLINQIVF